MAPHWIGEVPGPPNINRDHFERKGSSSSPIIFEGLLLSVFGGGGVSLAFDK